MAATAAHPTAYPTDFRKITHLAALSFGGPGNYATDITVRDAVDLIIKRRAVERVVISFDSPDGVVLGGPPSALLPILNALLTHADTSGASDE